jgi:hypothetical protein
MDEGAANSFFAEDLEKLRNIASGLRIRQVLSPSDRTVTFVFGSAGRVYRVVLRAAADYPLSPTSVRFTAEGDVLDDSVPHWPQGVNGISAAERFVCIPGVAEGHQRHADWPHSNDRNRITDVTFRLIGLFGGVENDV